MLWLDEATNSIISKVKQGFFIFLGSIKTFFCQNSAASIRKWIFALVFGLLWFSSDYLTDSVSLYVGIALFLVLAGLYFLYAFPFRAIFRKGASPMQRMSSLIDLPFLIAFFFGICAMLSFATNIKYGHFYGYLGIAMFFLIGYLFSCCFTFKEFVNGYTRFFPILCFFSLVVFITVQITGIIPTDMIFFEDYTTKYSVGFFDSFLVYYYWKNQSVFWEPGIFASFIILGFILECVFKPGKPNKISLAIEFIALLTTGSLAGYLLAIPTIITILANKITSKPYRIFSYIFFSFATISLVSIGIFNSFFKNVFPILAEKGTSFTSRIYSFFMDIQIWTQSPVFGVGTAHFYSLIPELIGSDYSGLVDASLSTMGFYIAVFGLIGWIIMALYLISLFALPNKNLPTKIGLVFVSLLILNKEPHLSDTITWSLFFYFLSGTIDNSLLRWGQRFSMFNKEAIFRNQRRKNDEFGYFGKMVKHANIKI